MLRKCVRVTRRMRWCQGRYRLRRAELRMSAGSGRLAGSQHTSESAVQAQGWQEHKMAKAVSGSSKTTEAAGAAWGQYSCCCTLHNRPLQKHDERHAH